MKDIKLPNFEKLTQEVSREVYNRIKRRTPVLTGHAQAGWAMELSGTNAVISNSVPYIGILEEGSSTQAPNGMVRVTLEEVPDIINEVIRRDK